MLYGCQFATRGPCGDIGFSASFPMYIERRRFLVLVGDVWRWVREGGIPPLGDCCLDSVASVADTNSE